jgi:DNA ligase (NAD+)
MIENSVKEILKEISSGNNLGEPITLVGATKYVPVENINEGIKAGLKDIGEVTARSIEEYFLSEENLLEINALKDLGVKISEVEESQGTKLKGEKFVLTGTLPTLKRGDATKLIESLGGEVMSSVSKLTTVVLAGEEAGSKLEKARKLGIKIIDENEFLSLINS